MTVTWIQNRKRSQQNYVYIYDMMRVKSEKFLSLMSFISKLCFMCLNFVCVLCICMTVVWTTLQIQQINSVRKRPPTETHWLLLMFLYNPIKNIQWHWSLFKASMFLWYKYFLNKFINYSFSFWNIYIEHIHLLSFSAMCLWLELSRSKFMDQNSNDKAFKIKANWNYYEHVLISLATDNLIFYHTRNFV